jgi:hypothetical protein
MDASLRCAVQHDKVVSFQAFPLLSFRAIARKPVWMLHYAALFSMTRWCIPSIPFVVIPSDSEETSMDASLRCAVQHDKVVHSKHSLCCHSERNRGIHYGCFTTLRCSA